MSPAKKIKSDEQLLVFNGKSSSFSGWRQRVKQHLEVRSYKEEEDHLEGRRKYEPFTMYTAWLKQVPDEKPLTDKQKDEKAYQTFEFKRKPAEIRSLFANILPEQFVQQFGDDFATMPVHEIWSKLDRKYGMSTVATLLDRLRKFFRIPRENFKDLETAISVMKVQRNEVNSLAQKGLECDLISEELMLCLLLAELPAEYYGAQVAFEKSKFTLDRLEPRLISIFGDRSKKEITAMSSTNANDERNVDSVQTAKSKRGKVIKNSGMGQSQEKGKGKGKALVGNRKRPYETDTESDSEECHYCRGTYNQGGSHIKDECPLKDFDRKQMKLFRSDFTQKGRFIEEPNKGGTKKGGKSKKVRKQSKTKVDATKDESGVDATKVEDQGAAPLTFEVMEDLEDMDVDDAEMQVDALVSDSKGPDLTAISSSLQEIIEDMDSTVRLHYPYLLSERTMSNHEWVLDSGCGQHLTGRRDLFSLLKDNTRIVFTFGQGSKLSSNHIGIIHVGFDSVDGIRTFRIHNVAYVPGAKSNIVSENGLKHDGYQIVTSNCAKYKYVLRDGTLQFVGVCIKGAYYIKGYDMGERQKACNAAKLTPVQPTVITRAQATALFYEWHVRLGHIHKESLIDMMSKGRVDGMPQLPPKVLNSLDFFCHTCAAMKHRRMSFRNLKGSRSEVNLGTLHMDLCGPIKQDGRYGNSHQWKYGLTMIDDHSSHRWSSILRKKSEVPQVVKDKIASIECETKGKIQKIRSDGGLEFDNKELETFYKGKGMKYEKSNPYYKEENGSAERDFQTKFAKVRCALMDANLKAKWWPEAFHYMTYVQNRTPMRRLGNKTPFEVLHGKKPDLSNVRIWGSVCYANIPAEVRADKKLSARGTKCRLLGIAEDYKGYRLLDVYNDKVIVSRDVVFDSTFTKEVVTRSFDHAVKELSTKEKMDIKDLLSDANRKRPLESESQGAVGAKKARQTTEVVGADERQSCSHANAGAPSPTRRPTRPPGRIKARKRKPATPRKIGKSPRSINEALSRPDKMRWVEALQSEYDSLMDNGTWKLVKLPKGRKALPCHWVFNIKYHSDGNIERYKARLVAQGNHQEFGVDCDDCYAPVARFESLRLVLAIAVINDFVVVQMDVSTAFLNGWLPKGMKIYMRQPHGFVVKGSEHLVCELRKSLYGLKQAPRIWYLVLHEFLTQLGFVRCHKEYCLYVRRVGEEMVIIVVYVDDLTIMAKRREVVDAIKDELNRRFKMKDLGDINYLLKMEVQRDMDNKTMTISQRKYVQDLLEKYGMQDCISAPTPQAVGVELKAERNMTPQQIAAQPFDYRGLVGSLQYLVRGTRPDIANAVRELSTFLSCYNKTHWQAARRVLKYLKGTSNYGLRLDGSKRSMVYEVYTDASFACREKERKSVSGYVAMLAGTCVSWSSSKQACVALSTTESELVALSEGVKESEWFWQLLSELGFTMGAPIQLWCDSKAAIDVVSNPTNHKSTKHIETRHLFVRDLVQKERIHVEYCPTKDMVADLLTKALPPGQFQQLRERMGVLDLDQQD